MLSEKLVSTDNNHLRRLQRADLAGFLPIGYLQCSLVAVVPAGDMPGSPDLVLFRLVVGKALDVVLVVDLLALDVEVVAHTAAAVVVAAQAHGSAL